MKEKVYLHLMKDSAILAEKWLQASGDISCVILSPPGCEEEASVLQKKFPHVTEARKWAASNPGMSPMESHARVVIPVQLKQQRMRFAGGIFCPDVQPLYPWVQNLYQQGVRKIELFSLNGTLPLQVPHLLDDFTGRHLGKRCFIVGNGPSLNQIDMSRLKNEITFGSNRCFLGYEKWGFPFTYWGICDRLQIEEYRDEYEKGVPRETVKFIPFEYLPWLKVENFCPLNHLYDYPDYPQFSHSPDRIFLGSTVTYLLLQVAVMMGCNPIYFVGLDHRYHLKDYEEDEDPKPPTLLARIQDGIRKRLGIPAVKVKTGPEYWTAAQAGAETHFDSRYATGGEKKFIRPRPRKAEKAFECALQWGKTHGVQMLNATPDSALKVFPQVSYESLF